LVTARESSAFPLDDLVMSRGRRVIGGEEDAQAGASLHGAQNQMRFGADVAHIRIAPVSLNDCEKNIGPNDLCLSDFR
jgi:hypothetical protein